MPELLIGESLLVLDTLGPGESIPTLVVPPRLAPDSPDREQIDCASRLGELISINLAGYKGHSQVISGICEPPWLRRERPGSVSVPRARDSDLTMGSTSRDHEHRAIDQSTNRSVIWI
ncbi:MAG: hypothetical protein K0V04_12685 [Deltaproteobacteria bacterium]|nr:hypothetical protein [Deltaproteobacteria bacterium]